jgi:hypothetical protein
MNKDMLRIMFLSGSYSTEAASESIVPLISRTPATINPTVIIENSMRRIFTRVCSLDVMVVPSTLKVLNEYYNLRTVKCLNMERIPLSTGIRNAPRITP